MGKSEDLVVSVICFDHFSLDASRRTLHRSGVEVDLRAKCFDLLLCLARRAGSVVTKTELIEAVWPDVIVTDESLTRCVSDIRQALGDANQKIVKTVPRRGYLLAAPVSFGAPQAAGWTSPPSAPAPGVAADLRRIAARRWRGLGACAALAAIFTAGATWLSSTRSPSDGATAIQSQIHALPTAATRPMSIVVLPLVNRGGDPSQAYFADGLTNDLTTDLSRIAGSFVIARSSANVYEGKSVDVRQIGRELGVRYVLEGSVQRIDDLVRLNLRLIDAQSGGELWADRMDGSRFALSELQWRVTGTVARTLHLELIAAESRRSQAMHPINPSARDLIWQAFAVMQRFTPESNVTARDLLERSVVIDPDSACAWAGLAHTYASDLANRWVTGAVRDEWLIRAEQAANKAYAIDPEDPTVVSALGRVLLLLGKPEQGLVMFQHVVALNRNYAPGWLSISLASAELGNTDESMIAAQEALRLSPRDTRLHVILAAIAASHYYAGRDQDALVWAKRSAAAKPTYGMAYAWAAAAAANLGNTASAREALAEFKRLQPDSTIAILRAERHSANTEFLRQRERFYMGLQRAGLAG
jgi:TolB-like protein/DNA-binding winged helix-turn-helix (wHTH) protein/Tfp pilus assembly protein PilF